MARGRWPEKRIIHWIVPLHKKGSVYAAGNYRGVHVTAQISKAMEIITGETVHSILLKKR